MAEKEATEKHKRNKRVRVSIGAPWKRRSMLAMSQLGHYVNRRNVQAAVFPGLALLFSAGGGNKRCRRGGMGARVDARILHRGKDNDYSEAKGSSCRAAGARGGGREGSPRCSRILRVLSGGRIVAKMQSRPPHKWQAKTSAAKEQFSYCISRSGTDTACYFG